MNQPNRNIELQRKASHFLNLFASRIDIINKLHNGSIRTYLNERISETKDLIDKMEVEIALDNFLNDLLEFDFPLNVDEMDLLKSIVNDFGLITSLGEYCEDIPQLTSGGFSDRENYQVPERDEQKIYGKIINLTSIHELLLKFNYMNWNLRLSSSEEVTIYNKWCELDFLPGGKIFSGSIKADNLERLKEIFTRYRLEVEIDK